MEPIISPWLIYAISLLTRIYITAFVCAFLSVSVSILIGIFLLYGPPGAEITKKGEKIFKYSVVVFITSVVLVILIPTKDTMIAMVGASYVTPDNIQAVQDNIVDFVHQIAQAIK